MFNKQLENYEVLGYLNDKNDVKISIYNPNTVYVKITVLSDIPDSVDITPHNDQIKVYVSDIPDLEDNSTESDFIRKGNIIRFMEEHLLSVQPLVKQDNKDKIYYVGKNVQVLNKANNFNSSEQLCAIPTFSNKKMSNLQSIYDFSDFLNQRTNLGNIKNPWPYNESDIPFGIIWMDNNKSYLFFDIDKQSHNGNGLAFKMNSLKFIPLNNDWINNQYHNSDLTYIPKEFISNHKDEAQQLNNDNITSLTDDNVDINITKDNTNNKFNISINNSSDMILNRFMNMIRSSKYNLNISNSDIINFHNSIKSNILTLLAGLSGTGKSKIATAYADTLGIKNKEQFNMVSVRPFWQDDSDVLGFVNTLNSTYNPGDSGVIDTLIHAQKNPDKMHLIVFDEMNLARVEYYFSQFLSVLEKDPEDRYIQLYNPSLEPRLYNNNFYPHSIKIPENVRFIGTMNIDETTFQISDKVLDRSNVITLAQQSFLNQLDTNTLNKNNEQIKYYNEIPYSTYKNTIYNNESILTNEELHLLDDLNYCIQKSIPNVGISWRIVKNIEKFLSNVSHYKYNQFTRKEALDYQIAQRILPKLRGTKGILSELLNFNKSKESNDLISILNKYKNISDFSRTKDSLNKKRKEIQVMGFAN